MTRTNLKDMDASGVEVRTRTSIGLGAALLAVLGGLGASLCCIGPILFVTLGIGAGLASTFEPLRPLFTAITVVALASFFLARFPSSDFNTFRCRTMCLPPIT